MPGMTLKAAEVLIRRLKEEYPRPLALASVLPGPYCSNDYCVGGSYLCLRSSTYAASFGRKFPSPSTVRWELMKDNPALNFHHAYKYGTEIVKANDADDFDKAYELLLEALTYQPPEVTC